MSSTTGRLKIFLLTGQSNSLGTTADPDEKNIYPGENPVDQEIPFFWRNRSTLNQDGVARLYGDSEGRITTLQPQQGEGKNPAFWGPEIGFGRELVSDGIKDFLIVKASRGGGGNGFWVKNSSDDHMYRHVVETVQLAVSALPSGMKFDITAMLYVQGESDSEEEANISAERLILLAANLRNDLPHARDMKVVTGGIAAPGPRRDIVRKQQSLPPTMDHSFVYVDNADLSTQLYDQLHFNKRAKLEIGRRMARAWLDSFL